MSALTTPEAVAYINRPKERGGERYAIGAETLIELAKAGRAPGVRLGRGWFWAEEALDRWLANGMQP